MKPWNYWYHVTNSTYATWLRGDPRGWRARHHREHVDGDYKNPPPMGMYDKQHAHSKALLTRPSVVLTWEQQMIVCRTMAEALAFHKIGFDDLAIGPKHFHLLAQFSPDRLTGTGRPILDPARHFTGIAKKESARRLSSLGHIAPGGAWAEKSHPIPVEDEDHFSYLKDKYIPGHVREGAVVWSMHVANESRAKE